MKLLLTLLSVVSLSATVSNARSMVQKEVLLKAAKSYQVDGANLRANITVDNYRNLNVELIRYTNNNVILPPVNPLPGPPPIFPPVPPSGDLPEIPLPTPNPINPMPVPFPVHSPSVTSEHVATLSTRLMGDEYNEIIDMLVVLANAEMDENVHQMICMILPPSSPSHVSLSILRDFNWRTNSFDGSMTNILAKACYLTTGNLYLNRENYNVADDLLDMVFHITDLITADNRGE